MSEAEQAGQGWGHCVAQLFINMKGEAKALGDTHCSAPGSRQQGSTSNQLNKIPNVVTGKRVHQHLQCQSLLDVNELAQLGKS